MHHTSYVITLINQVLMSAPDSKVHGANMGPIWGRQDPAGTHVGHMNFAIWDIVASLVYILEGILSIYGDW